MARLILYVLLCFFITFQLHTSPAKADDGNTIYYNSYGNKDKTLGFKVLQLAIEKSGKPYQLKPSPMGYNTTPAMINALADGSKLDIAWVNATKAFEGKALAVPFPIDRGLVGYRIFLIDGARQDEFSRIKTLDDLRHYIGLLGIGWADVDIMRKNGLTVRTAPQKNLYRMTVGGRGDYFSRAINEAFNEQAAQVATAPGLAVEKTLILHYPSAAIFYVPKSRPQLRDDLLNGLKLAWQDGSFKKVFMADPDVQLAFTKGDLKKRTIIDIHNPNLPQSMLEMDKQYWLNPRE
ncbi:hypothetical protein NAC44_00475 [Allorhizobium sp. BGMRC 0089]|uniref:hypothetical protein n=1 Tax=Allorhizobium sonneratiae TaxID=2934936 RepID=UPI00203339C1|nr:hypothetical protein [Allorhizobium sonneratiae]MCM2290801.1 hypothetical protein [Allorhizobium sonneratiae]